MRGLFSCRAMQHPSSSPPSLWVPNLPFLQLRIAGLGALGRRTRLLRIPGRQSRSWDAEQANSPAPHPRKAKSFLECGALRISFFFDVPKQKGRGGLKPDEVVAFLFRILLGVFRILLVVSCKPPAMPSKHATSHLQSRESGGRKEADTEKPRT